MDTISLVDCTEAKIGRAWGMGLCNVYLASLIALYDGQGIVTSTLYLISILQAKAFCKLLSSSVANLTKHGFRFPRQSANNYESSYIIPPILSLLYYPSHSAPGSTVVRASTRGAGGRGSIPDRVIPKTVNMTDLRFSAWRLTLMG